MRLICPNCGAQYEVDDNVIPDLGRDVQCSNCGHTWFQRSAKLDSDASGRSKAAAARTDDREEVVTDEAGQDHLPEEAPADDDDHLPEDRPAIADEAGTEEGGEDEDQPEVDDDAPAKTPKPRSLDPEVADILREEAARESAERAGEAGTLETQTDLGLNGNDEMSGDSDDSADTAEDDEHDEEKAAVAALVAASARRDLLPDIEEINSTLTASEDRDEEDPEERQDRRNRSGFRRGFLIALVFFAVLALIYVYAPRIVEAAPRTEAAMASYVDTVNGLRVWVDTMMQQAVAKLTVLLGQVSGEG